MSKILIADDDARLVQSLSQILSREGLEVKTAANGKEALLLLKKEPFDLLVLDLQMPEMDGSRVLLEIRSDSKLKDLKVLVCSSAQDWEKGSESLLLQAKSAAWFPEKNGWDGRYTEVYKYGVSEDPTAPGAFSTDIVQQIKEMLKK